MLMHNENRESAMTRKSRQDQEEFACLLAIGATAKSATAGINGARIRVFVQYTRCAAWTDNSKINNGNQLSR